MEQLHPENHTKKGSNRVKTCSKCKRDLPIDNFGSCTDKRRGKTYLRCWCKTCEKEYQRQYRQKNREKNIDFKPNPKLKKRCSNCGKSKPQTHFSPDPGNPTPLDSWCRRCRAKIAREKIQKDPDLYNKKARWQRREKRRQRRYKKGSRIDTSGVPKDDPVGE